MKTGDIADDVALTELLAQAGALQTAPRGAVQRRLSSRIGQVHSDVVSAIVSGRAPSQRRQGRPLSTARATPGVRDSSSEWPPSVARASPGRAIGLTVIYAAAAAVLPAIAIGLLAREAVALIRSESGDLAPLSLVGVLLVLEQVLGPCGALGVDRRKASGGRRPRRLASRRAAKEPPLPRHGRRRVSDRPDAGLRLSSTRRWIRAAAGTAVLLARFSPWLARRCSSRRLDVRLTGQYGPGKPREAQAPAAVGRRLLRRRPSERQRGPHADWPRAVGATGRGMGLQVVQMMFAARSPSA